MFYQKEIETLKRPDIEVLQLERLKQLVEYCDKNSPFYNKKLKEAGVSADKIKTLSDIQYLPFTTKDDIRDNYPFGLFAVPMRDIVRIHASSGTTGKPTVVGYTKGDLDTWSDLVARLVVAAGATRDDIAQILFGYGLFTGALGLHYGLERIGAAVIPSSSGNTEKQIMLMKDFGTTTIISTPSYAMYIAEKMQEMGIDKSQLKLRLGLFGSEGWSREMRSKIEDALGLFATDNYGMSELMGPGVAGECVKRCGMHVAEDHFIPEIVDAKTLEPVPHGESGELVITTLTKRGIPLIRYRTKDISRLYYDQCECGRTHVRMEKIMGRTDDMLKIRGVNVFPTQIESVLIAVNGIGPQYELVVDSKGVMDTLEVRVELADESLLDKFSKLEQLSEYIKERLKVVLGIQCKVTLVEPKTLTRYQGKAKRIIDNRKK